MTAAISDLVIETTLLRGKVKLLQPKKGFHASLDTVFLAASLPAMARGTVLDMGCGVGSAGLTYTLRNKNNELIGIDIQQDLIDISHQNAALNGLSDRCRFFCTDIADDTFIAPNSINAVMMNPPYYEEGAHTPSPLKNKALSHGEASADLKTWIKFAHSRLKQGGTLALVHRADRLNKIITLISSRNWFGNIEIYPLFSKETQPAKRVIVRARKERFTPLKLHRGLIIHMNNGKYTTESEEILSEFTQLF